MITYNIPDVMTTDDVCGILNIKKSLCLSMLKDGVIKGFKIGNSRYWRISKPALIEYINGKH